MEINLTNEQQFEVFKAMLIDDYQRIVSGVYSEDCLKYKDAFETLFGFYLSGSKREALADTLNESEQDEIITLRNI